MSLPFKLRVCHRGLARLVASWALIGVAAAVLLPSGLEAAQPSSPSRAPSTAAVARRYQFDGSISREVLEGYLSRAISMEGLFNGRGDLEDNFRMLQNVGAKFIGRSLCLWAGESRLLTNLARAREQIPRLHQLDPEMVLQACIFEIVTVQVEEVPVPDWALRALGLPVEPRHFRYADMLYSDGRRKDHWGKGASVPDVSRPETRLWFYFLAASYIDLGIEAIHFGQTELMNGNDRDLAHYAQILGLIRSYAAIHARRHTVLCDSHVPSGGLVREGRLLMDFHSFPLRILELPDRPQEAVLKQGFSDGLYGRSKGGLTPSGWRCEHLPYLVEIDNWGASRKPGQAGAGGIWIWGYDEITWLAHQDKEYRANWLRYAGDWLRRIDPNAHLQMPGSRTLSSPLDRKRWYHANTPSPAVPEGLDDERAIRSIWNEESRWVNVTGNLAGLRSECGNLCLLSAVPGPDRILAGVARRGLWQSTHGGGDWTALGTAPGSEAILNRPSWILYDPDPARPGRFWESGIYNGPGIYHTGEEGRSFQHLGAARHNDFVSVDFSDPQRRTLLAGGHEQSRTVWKSVDGGQSWTNIGMALPEGTKFSSSPLLIDSSNYVVNASGWGKGTGGVYRTADGGVTWTQASPLEANGSPLRASDGSIYWLLMQDRGVIRSVDQGHSWSQVCGPGILKGTGIIELPDGTLAGVSGRGIQVSTDHGAGWTSVTGPAPVPPSGLIYAPARHAFFIWSWDCGDQVLTNAIWRHPYRVDPPRAR